MKALFLTTHTNDVDSLVRAWDCQSNIPAERIIFQYGAQVNDAQILRDAAVIAPDVIFYIGGCARTGMPKGTTFKSLRNLAPSIHLCCDAGDAPWHPLLQLYKEGECFDLQVTLDGREDAPVDHVTITPVAPLPYCTEAPAKDISCGFSGGVGRMSKRNRWLGELDDLVKVRKRVKIGGYEDHANFLRRCKSVFNTSFTGSGKSHQVKGRVLESALAKAAVIEHEDSPAHKWFPPHYFLSYRTAEDVKDYLHHMSDTQFLDMGKQLHRYVRDNYHPAKIFRSILEKANVDTSLPSPTA